MEDALEPWSQNTTWGHLVFWGLSGQQSSINWPLAACTATLSFRPIERLTSWGRIPSTKLWQYKTCLMRPRGAVRLYILWKSGAEPSECIAGPVYAWETSNTCVCVIYVWINHLADNSCFLSGATLHRRRRNPRGKTFNPKCLHELICVGHFLCASVREIKSGETRSQAVHIKQSLDLK